MQRGRLILGVLLVLLAHLQQLYGPMKGLARLSSVIAKGQAGAERVEEVLRAPTVVRERPDAVEAAYVDEFVSQVPDGYDTPVAEGGVSLSGGPRQRMSIARALAARAPVVVLDEPTSGLAAVSEAQVVRGLAALTAERTVLVVAHRLSTLRDADRVHVVERGRVVDAGTHRELSPRTGTYRAVDELLLAP